MRLPTLLLIVFVSHAAAQDQLPASVSGIVMNASTNSPFPGVMVMMAGGGVTTTDDNGRFTLKEVRPGTWTIQALRTGTAPPARDSAPRMITVKPGEEIRDVRLGKVIVRGSTNAIRLEEVAIRGGPPVVMASADGTFTLREVGEGSQSIRVDGLPPDAYVADIRQGPVSLFDAARTLSGPQYTVSGSYAVPLEVIVSPNGGVIDGVIDAPAQQNVAGSTVVLVPGPSRRFVQTQYRSAVVGSTGEFTFRGLAPGVYHLYAWESVPNTAWLNPDFMSSFEGRGQSVAVESGKRQSTRVRLIQRED